MAGENPTFSVNLRAAFSASGKTILAAAQATGIPKRTIDSWVSPSAPRVPRADEAVRLAQFLNTTVEEIATGVAPQSPPSFAFGDIIQDLNLLPEHRLEDVRRLIAPWANEARGAAQQIIDIVADLKVLPASRLEDLRRLVKPWADEIRGAHEGGKAKAG